MQNIHKHLTPNDFIIIIRPIREEEDVTSEPGNWTGEVQVSIVTNDKETTLTESEFNGMVTLCNFAAASIPAMEENVVIRDLIRTYAQNNMIMPTPEEEPIAHRLLTLDTDTEGNA
jgi:hypothetical protein|tara:strand:+ start:609 stop:956 length:348 start_codon:yes stop_codon:yes gene_type:complete